MIKENLDAMDRGEQPNSEGDMLTEDVAPGAVVAGVPARFIKMKDEKTSSKTQIMDALRQI